MFTVEFYPTSNRTNALIGALQSKAYDCLVGVTELVHSTALDAAVFTSMTYVSFAATSQMYTDLQLGKMQALVPTGLFLQGILPTLLIYGKLLGGDNIVRFLSMCHRLPPCGTPSLISEQRPLLD